MSPKPQKPKNKRKRDYRINDEMISQKFADLLLKGQKMPTYAEIAKELGVSSKTIERHIKDMNFDKRFSKFKSVSDRVVMNIFKQAATGKNHHFARLWLELMEGLGQNKKIDVTTKGESINAASRIKLPDGTEIDI